VLEWSLILTLLGPLAGASWRGSLIAFAPLRTYPALVV